MQRAFAAGGFECAVEDADVFFAEAAADDGSVLLVLNVFDGVVGINVSDDALDLIVCVAEGLERGFDGLVDDFESAAACEQFVFHERDIGLDAGGVAIHEEADGAGGCEHGDLCVAVAVFFAERKCGVPCLAGFVFQIAEAVADLDALDAVAVLLDDFEHRGDVVLGEWFWSAAATRIAVAGECAH